MNLRIGIDIGGTKIELLALNENSKVVFKQRLPTQRELGYQHILNQIQQLFKILFKELNTEAKILSVGISMPGTVDPQKKIMPLGNTRVLENKHIINDIQEKLKLNCDFFIENDANCFALAEYSHGLKLDQSSLLGVILGTGVGGGLIVNGKIHRGLRGSAAEIGHISLFEAYEECYCGQSGCVEQYLSGKGLEREFFNKTKKELSSIEILSLSEEQRKYQQRLARTLGVLVNVLDPEYIVLGGGISLQSFLYENLEELLTPHLFYKNNPPKVLKHQVSDSSGSLGACLLYTNM